MSGWLSRGEREGYAALDRARENNHYMEPNEHFPVVGTKWQC